jgi:hypothetical protein
MAQQIMNESQPYERRDVVERPLIKDALTPTHQAYQILHWGFVAVPAIAGIDKFLHVLTNWDHYLSPAFASFSPFSVHTTMMVVGVIELVASLLVAVRPKIGAYVVAAWLGGIILNLALLGGELDVALRDFGLLVGAIALARLAIAHERSHVAA